MQRRAQPGRHVGLHRNLPDNFCLAVCQSALDRGHPLPQFCEKLLQFVGCEVVTQELDFAIGPRAHEA